MSDGSVIIDTKLDNKGFKSGIEKLEDIGKKGMTALTTSVATVTTAMAGLGAYAVKVGSNFEEGMSKVQAISGATGDELQQLKEKAIEMGSKTKFSATESAEAFQYMAMAGWKTSDMLNGIEGIMNLSAASGENLATVSDIVTDALTAFGLQAKDSAHFADVLAKASSNSNTNVGMMGATFKYVAPIAGSMKYSIEDTAVAIGLMANAGIKGEQAGTALRAMLTRLVKPPKDASKALDKLNISVKKSDGTMKPLSEVLDDLRKKFNKLNDSQKAEYASSIAGQEAMSGLLAIVNASDDDYKKLTKAINNANGAAKEQADIMQKNLKGAMTECKSVAETLALKVYEKFKGPMTDGVNSVKNALSKLTEQVSSGKLSNSLDKVATGFGNLISKAGDLVAKILPKLIDGLAWVLDHGETIAKAIGVITGAIIYFKTTATFSAIIKELQIGQTAVGLLTGKINLVTIAQKLWNTAMKANPVGVVIGIIGGLIAILGVYEDKISRNEKKTREAFSNMGNSAKDFITGIDSAKSHLEEFDSTLFASSEEQQKLQDEMKEVQEGITNICKTASDERRGYTQEEITQLDQYFQKLRELNQREIEIQQSISTAITQQAVTNAETLQGSLEEYKQQSQEWLKTAEDQKTKTIDLINKQSIEEIALLNQRYGEEANMQNENYANEYNKIIGQKEEKIAQANDEVAKINKAYTDGYLERSKQEDGFLTVMSEYNKQAEEENNRHNKKMQDIEDGNFNKVLGRTKERQAEAVKHNDIMKNIWNDMYKNMSEEQANELGVWIAMVTQTEMYGGEISEENQKMIDNILDSYDKMPPKTQEAMKNAMQPMLEEMENKEPSLFAKAKSIADGILSRLKKAFDIHSPSKKTREIFKYVMLGAQEGLDDEENSLYKKIKKIANTSNELYDKMKSTVDFETARISANLTAEATLRASRDDVRTVNNDNGINITNTQQFYEREATPYEQQKQAKEQLRRLAYEI